MLSGDEAALAKHEVRLFPSVHITSDREAELRATASLLSMIRAVSEFGRTIVRLAGGPAGQLSCFTEVSCKLASSDGSPPDELRPDGVILAVRGKTRWSALVEVKIGNTDLDPAQVDKYHRVARQEGVSAVMTVSNQPTMPDGRAPVSLDGRRLRAVPVVHFSWERLLSEAQFLSRKKAVSDPDQKWMLDEWIRYVEDSESRIIVPPELGPHWQDVLKAARTSALGQTHAEVRDVCLHWMGYLRKAALRLRAKLGVEVQIHLSRKERNDSQVYLDSLVTGVRGNSSLSGVFRIPDAAGDVAVEVFLPSRVVQYCLQIEAPTEGRQATRVAWLARQLRGLSLPSGLAIDIDWNVRGLKTTAPAQKYVEFPECLQVDSAGAPVAKDATPRAFALRWERPLQPGRGRSNAPVLEGITHGLETFYRSVVEHLIPFVPRAPRLVTREPHHRGRDPDRCVDLNVSRSRRRESVLGGPLRYSMEEGSMDTEVGRVMVYDPAGWALLYQDVVTASPLVLTAAKTKFVGGSTRAWLGYSVLGCPSVVGNDTVDDFLFTAPIESFSGDADCFLTCGGTTTQQATQGGRQAGAVYVYSGADSSAELLQWRLVPERQRDRVVGVVVIDVIGTSDRDVLFGGFAWSDPALEGQQPPSTETETGRVYLFDGDRLQ